MTFAKMNRENYVKLAYSSVIVVVSSDDAFSGTKVVVKWALDSFLSSMKRLYHLHTP